jgi:hypothetical protein
VFERLGKKGELIGRLIEFCRDRAGCDDVVVLCGAYVPRQRPGGESAALREGGEGFVYLMKSGRYYKIGRSNAVGRREYELAIQLPERAMMVHKFRTDDPVGIEAYWRRRFETKRRNGEWFDLDPADVAAFKRRKLFM